MVSAKAVQEAIDDMGATLKFFPSSAAAIAQFIAEMAENDEQVRWLAKRMPQLYNEWPGALEMRAVFCSKFKPRDGIEAYSRDPRYLEGIPSERERQTPALPAPAMKALPPGRVVSGAASVDGAIRDLARAKDMNARGPVSRVRDIPVLPPGRRITEADIKRAEEEFRRRQREQELAALALDEQSLAAGDFSR